MNARSIVLGLTGSARSVLAQGASGAAGQATKAEVVPVDPVLTANRFGQLLVDVPHSVSFTVPAALGDTAIPLVSVSTIRPRTIDFTLGGKF